jgi:hypothetical protein
MTTGLSLRVTLRAVWRAAVVLDAASQHRAAASETSLCH